MKKTLIPRGFTLIELLIVVAIIAILAAIAVPNFLEAQTRARVARVMADHRSMATALETYYVDNNDYILGWGYAHDIGLADNFAVFRDKFARWRLVGLTTPISYMTELPETPFWPEKYKHSDGFIMLDANLGSEYDQAFSWYNNEGAILAGAMYGVTKYHLRDPGPDDTWNNQNILEGPTGGTTSLMPYDPTNGTVSEGDIWRFGP